MERPFQAQNKHNIKDVLGVNWECSCEQLEKQIREKERGREGRMYAEGERESVQRTCLTHAITRQAANALYRNLNMLIDVSQINNPSNTGQADMTA